MKLKMKSKETAVIKDLGKYFHTAFKMREEYIIYVSTLIVP